MCPGFESLIRHHFLHPLESPAVQLVKWLVLATAVAATSAYAQARLFAIPAEAKAGTLRHVQGTLVELDGKQAWLAPGAQIRDVFNRLVVPTELMQKRTVRYLTDTSGLVHRVWLLTPEEVAQLPKPKPPAKKDEKKDEKNDEGKGGKKDDGK